MMHTREALLKGGEGGSLFLAGNVQDSKMLRRIHLPEHHDDHLPPDGKKQLTNEQYLKDLPYLEYLNLYGTQVSDEGIKQLAGLKT